MITDPSLRPVHRPEQILLTGAQAKATRPVQTKHNVNQSYGSGFRILFMTGCNVKKVKKKVLAAVMGLQSKATRVSLQVKSLLKVALS